MSAPPPKPVARRRSSTHRSSTAHPPPKLAELEIPSRPSYRAESSAVSSSPHLDRRPSSSKPPTTPIGSPFLPERRPSSSRRPRRQYAKSSSSSSGSTGSSSSESESSSDSDGDAPSGGLGDLIRSLHDNNEAQPSRKRTRLRGKGSGDDSDHSRASGSGSSAGLGRRRSNRTDSGQSSKKRGPLDRIMSRVSAPSTPTQSELDGGLPTVAEKPSSANKPNARPPPPAPSHTYNKQQSPASPHPDRNAFQNWWSPQAPPLAHRPSSRPGQSEAVMPEPAGGLPPRFGNRLTEEPRQVESRPTPAARSSNVSTLDPRRRHPAHLQNLNEPFIPEIPHHVQSVPKQVASAVYEYFSLADPLGRTTKHQNSHDATAPLHTIAALIATTGNLSGVVSPTCATIAPVWSYEDQGDVGGGSGGRRLSRYTRQEAVANTDMTKQFEADASEDDRHERHIRHRKHVKERRRRGERRSDRQDPKHRDHADDNPTRPNTARDRHPSYGRDGDDDRKGHHREEEDGSPPAQISRRRSDGTLMTQREQDHGQTTLEDEGQVNHNVTSPSDERLDVIAEEGTNEILRTEGASEPAFKAEYAEGEKHNIVRTPSGSPKAGPSPPAASSNTLAEIEDEDGFPFGDDAGTDFGTEVDLEREGERRRRRKSQYVGWIGSKRGERVQQEIYIKSNRSTLTQTRDFIVRLANAHMMFGSPTHRLESQLESTCRILELDAHFFYLPSHLILCFNNPRKQTSETAFLRATGALDSSKLAQVHTVNRDVLHDIISAAEGSKKLKEITSSPPLHPLWMRIIIIGMCSFFAAAVAFDGSFVDMCASFWLGSLMGLCQLTLAASNPLFLNCFEIAMALLVSFIAKGLSTTGYFCYQSLASAGIVMILPGYIILNGALELASRSIVAGSIRVVYGGILSLFLGTGISLGSEIFVAMKPSSKGKMSTTSLTGTFNSSDPTKENPINNGTFTFVDSTSSTVASGSIICERAVGAPWYMSTISPWYLFIIVPGFVVALSMWTKERIRSAQFCASMVIATVAYVALYFAKVAIPDQAEVTSAIAAFVIGILGTLWSRVARGTAFTTQSTAVLLLVPNGLAAAGGLAMSESSGQGSFEMGTTIALRQIQVAIGIVMGLFAASLCTYSFSRRKRSAYFSY